jgi:natural product precursor
MKNLELLGQKLSPDEMKNVVGGTTPTCTGKCECVTEDGTFVGYAPYTVSIQVRLFSITEVCKSLCTPNEFHGLVVDDHCS